MSTDCQPNWGSGCRAESIGRRNREIAAAAAEQSSAIVQISKTAESLDRLAQQLTQLLHSDEAES